MDLPSLVFQQAIAQLQQKNVPEALAILERLVNDHPDFAQGWHLLGRVAQDAGDHRSSLSLIGRAVAIDPQSVEFRVDLCHAQFNVSRLQEALQNYLLLCHAAGDAAARLPPEVRNALANHAAGGGIDEEVRPVSEVIGHAYPEATIDNAAIDAWLTSPEYAKEQAFFGTYPSHSLLATNSRLFLYHAVRAQKPEVVVEIGSYKVGTAEVIARALWENGRGTLYTTDPFGSERCPAIIGRWPTELRQHVQFVALGSMDFFLMLERTRQRIDLAFIDGNHDFEFAYFDLLMAARNLRPGGLVVMDNIEQQGPLFAALEFLRNNPAWQVLGRNFMSIELLGNPMTNVDMRSSIENASVLILKAPKFHAMSAVAFSTGQVPLQWELGITGLQVNSCSGLDDPAHGTLYWEVVYREFPAGQFPNEIKRGGAFEVKDGATINIPLSEPIARHSKGAPQTLEMNLYFSAAARSSPYAFESISIAGASGTTLTFYA